ncbi:hypothetical protein ABZ949_34325 [Micromonospora tulbaghiae]|uniref:HNH endonuclease n=1 Tax=Micromonospora tulbaghiae TaxID=479978 RepID=UPI00340BDCA6
MADYVRVADGRRSTEARQTLRMAIPSVADAYKSYEGAMKHGSHIDPITVSDDLKKELLANYDALNEGRVLNELRQELLQSITRKGQCPLCGRGRVYTLDHYLPKANYPEFSILSKNLVPACYRCNNKKLDRMHSPGDARFLHPYFDKLPSQPILAAHVDVGSEVSAIFSIVDHPAVSPELIRNARYHFRTLSLGDTYILDAAAELTEMHGQLCDVYGPDENSFEVQRWLSARYASIAQARGLNDWKTALYWSLAAHHDFCSGGFEAIGNYPT